METDTNKTTIENGSVPQGSGGQLDHEVIRPLHDLIYCSENEAKELLALYPDAKTENAEDMIHGDRFGFEVSDSDKNYLKNVIRLGFAPVSFMCQMATMQEDWFPLLTEIMKDLKAGV
jgi:hypothetical protein